MNNLSCCQIEAVVSVDDRGQIIIPKDVRKKFGIKAGEKYALVSCADSEDGQGTCCFTLVKTGFMKGMVQKLLGPMFKEIVGG